MVKNNISLQFELWGQCNNFCEFCYLSSEHLCISRESKLNNINVVSNRIRDYFNNNSNKVKAIGLIGGEFFQGQLSDAEIKKSFFTLIKQIFNLINEDRVNDFWCYVTLTLGDQKDLYELIDLFNDMILDKEKHHLLIQVSYDTKGRFNQPGKFDNWNYHMLNLQKYPFVRINVTSIMTDDFICKVLSHELDLTKFQEKYKNTFFFKPPYKSGKDEINTKLKLNKNLPWFFPKRKNFIAFLKYMKENHFALFENILNINLRADYLYNLEDNNEILKDPLIRNKETWEETANIEEINERCGHVTNYQCYSDSDACCLCDYLKVKYNI